MHSALLRTDIMRRGKWCAEPTLSELLSDPIIQAVMKADGVNSRKIERLMRRIMSHHNGQVRPTRTRLSPAHGDVESRPARCCCTSES
jgi:hypothetical protein